MSSYMYLQVTFSYSLTMSNYIWSPISYLWFTCVSKVFVLFSNRSLLEEVRNEMITDWLAVLTIQGLLSYSLFAVRTLLSSNSYPSLSLQPEPELEPEPCREDEDFAAEGESFSPLKQKYVIRVNEKGVTCPHVSYMLCP